MIVISGLCFAVHGPFLCLQRFISVLGQDRQDITLNCVAKFEDPIITFLFDRDLVQQPDRARSRRSERKINLKLMS
jgi:hypothetical protein